MAALPRRRMSVEEYLAYDRSSTQKHEYYDGQIYALAGASEQHNLIVGNVVGIFHMQLRGKGCRVYPSDMRVKVSHTGLYTYPDVTVVCGTPQFDKGPRDTLLNPQVIIEVLSPSTERYDRGKKSQNYRTLDSLEEYLLVAQDGYYIEHYVRQPNNQWLLYEATRPDETLHLASIGCDILLADVYELVEFDSADEETLP